ncbi:MAG: UDP-N-acetylmuramoyl-tripeptide--D-alanyl-D-alanine ligase [Candidatus Wallbacteria bacterium]|nr:UDP-N-acetylmuramoyl-tripeptide--D-alanyl-D-alanine ligase [Candidatus Wallbacteria bacterium]
MSTSAPVPSAEPMTLFEAGEAAAAAGGSIVAGDPRTQILGFSIDSRTVEPGDCFVAMPGQKVDGHDFVERAASLGATAAMVTRPLASPPAGLAILQVADPVNALQTLASLHRARFDVPFVAVTGSNGKTSTRAAIAATLGASFPVCSTRGNLNNHIGLPLSLFRMRRFHRAGVFEVGMNHLGEIAELCRILRPGMGVITNVAPAHLEGLGSIENVARAKGELMEALPASGELFVNADCELSRGIAARFAGAVRPISLDASGAFARAARLQIEFASLSGQIRVEGSEIPFTSPVSGRHMAYPLLFAAAVAARLGLGAEAIGRGLAQFRPEHGRMEVHRSGEVWIIDDCYNANPASMEAALDFLLSAPVEGKRWAVLGDMLELGGHSAHYHRQVLARCEGAAGLEAAFCFGKEFLDAAGGPTRGGRVELHASKSAIADTLRARIGPGDAVLFKGSRGVALETILRELFPEG